MAPELVKFRASNKGREGLRVCACSSGSSRSFGRWLQVGEIRQRFGWVAGACSTRKRGRCQWMHLQDPEAQVWCVLEEATSGAESPASTSTVQERVALTVHRPPA